MELCDTFASFALITFISVILLGITFASSIYLSVQFICKNGIKQNDSKLVKRTKCCSVFAELICTIAQVSNAIMVLFAHNLCPGPTVDTQTTQTRVAGSVSIYLYCFSLTSLYLIFSGRVYAAFAGSMCQLSNKTMIFIKFIFITQLSVNISATIAYLFHTEVSVILLAFSTVCISLYLYFVYYNNISNKI